MNLVFRSLIFNKSALQRGLFRSTSVKKYITSIQKNQSTAQDDLFMKPDPTKVTGMRHGSYDKLNDKGYVPEETVIVNGDIIIGKVSPIQPSGNNNKIYKDSSEVYKSHAPGVIDKVYTGIYNNEGYEMIKCRVRSQRYPTIGDKFCLALNSEALTSTGWKFVKDLEMTDKIAVLEDNKLKYVNPIGIYNRDYNGKMYKLNSTYVNLDVTFDHELYVKTNKIFEHMQAKDVIGKSVNYKVGGVETENQCQDKFVLPKCNDHQEKELDMNTWLTFYGILIGCKGYWIENECTIYPNNDDTYNKLSEVCNMLGFEHFENNDTFCIKSKQLVEYLKNVNNTVTDTCKCLLDFVWNLSTKQSKLLIDSIIFGASSNNDYDDEINTIRSFNTLSKQLADDLQRLCLHAGLSAIVKINEKTNTVEFNMNVLEPLINQQLITKYKYTESVYDYNGKVYCLEVPSHVFMMRYEGKISFCGQCSRHG